MCSLEVCILYMYTLLQVAGKIPIPPRYAFGIYYSRYHAYNDVGEMVCKSYAVVSCLYNYN